jgi:DNA (cytosine-5)-methyltransferase 1
MPLKPIPVVDLFAGPGGLSEGFSCLKDAFGNRAFDVRVSIEKDQNAAETLKLRAFFRSFQGKVPDCYYDYLRGNLTKEELVANGLVTEEWRQAEHEAHRATLGETASNIIDRWIFDAIGKHDPWVLIGDPPCQAYSLAGRSRRRGADPVAFEQDQRHFLYREYLRIIRKFTPALFVMENVKGMLSSVHGGSFIFDRIFADLSRPETGLEYDIRSFVSHNENLKPKDFIIEAERHGIPQKRHRVFLFGVRSDYASKNKRHRLLTQRDQPVTVREAISALPKLRSRLSLKSPQPDSTINWLDVVSKTPKFMSDWSDWKDPRRSDVISLMTDVIRQTKLTEYNVGSRFVEDLAWADNTMSPEFTDFIKDTRLLGVCQHETRSHMPSDLHRYLFAACYAEIYKF